MDYEFSIFVENPITLEIDPFDSNSSPTISVNTEIIVLEVQTSNTISLQLQSEPFTTIQGPPGPQGPSGSSVGYTHIQSVASTVWTVNHNLGFVPSVSVQSAGGVEVEASIQHTSNNQFLVYFESEYMGKAIAR